MKYRPTPFHLLALYFLIEGIYSFYQLSKIDHDTELGELLPYMSIGLSFITLIVDLIFQALIHWTVKTNPKAILYITQTCLLMGGLLWVWLNLFPTVHTQQ